MSAQIQQPRPTPTDPAHTLKAPYRVSDLPALKALCIEQSGRLSGAWQWLEDNQNARPETLEKAQKRFELLLTGYSTTCSIIRRLERLQEKGAVNE